MKFLNVILLFCLACACKSYNEKQLEQMFPSIDSLKFQCLGKSDFFMGKPNNLVVLEDYIVLQDRVDGFWFALLDKNTGSLICRFGKIGRGPNELIHPFALKGKNNNIIFTEQNKRKMYVYSMDSIFTNSSNYVINEIELKFSTNEYATYRCLWPLSSGQILASAVHPAGRIVLLDPSGNEKRCFSPVYPYDPFHKEEDYKIKSKAFQYDIAVNEDERLVCNVAISTGHFEIFKWKKDSLMKIVEHIFYLPKYVNLSNKQMLQIAFEKDSKPGFSHLRCVNDKIWLNTQDEKKHGVGIDHIICFNWKGEIIACYKPNMILKHFSIAPDGKNLYAIAMDPETLEPVLVFTSL